MPEGRGLRLFFGVEIGEPGRGFLEGIIRDLGSAGADVKLSRGGRFHLTLAFLGQVSPERVSASRDAGAAAARGAGEFEGRLGPLGAFPDWEKPKILWAGVAAGAPDLSSVARALSVELEERGFAVEGRVFVPHVTIGRVRSPRGLARLRACAAECSAPAGSEEGRFGVRELILYRSRLEPGGAVHEPVSRFPLGAAA